MSLFHPSRNVALLIHSHSQSIHLLSPHALKAATRIQAQTRAQTWTRTQTLTTALGAPPSLAYTRGLSIRSSAKPNVPLSSFASGRINANNSSKGAKIFVRSKSTTKAVAASSSIPPQGLLNTPGFIRTKIKQGLWIGLGIGTVVSAVGIAWSPSYRDQATLMSAAVFRSVATFITGYVAKLKHF
ncbi:hypothetical protein F5H01DRAFT_130647 [Linnemannia elongata]|nr:hypothetical protein F5H01DRAFT_130647 [Linnemannia elongata]